MYVVSACLIGKNCKYNGGNNYNQAVCKFLADKKFISLCPEEAGGLATPRAPSEIVESGGCLRVITCHGEDVTGEFEAGAVKCCKMAEDFSAETGEALEGAILKARSPSCGNKTIYDGTFSGREIPGSGIFAAKLQAKGVLVINEDEITK